MFANYKEIVWLRAGHFGDVFCCNCPSEADHSIRCSVETANGMDIYNIGLCLSGFYTHKQFSNFER